ncbi:MAG: hypothetical protein NTX04_03665, partial [Verrucomicrobia bacterium]|nr:hypothetical protein [Verrucomicrobiota bacterium]
MMGILVWVVMGDWVRTPTGDDEHAAHDEHGHDGEHHDGETEVDDQHDTKGPGVKEDGNASPSAAGASSPAAPSLTKIAPQTSSSTR